jgi:hypothetical protein
MNVFLGITTLVLGIAGPQDSPEPSTAAPRTNAPLEQQQAPAVPLDQLRARAGMGMGSAGAGGGMMRRGGGSGGGQDFVPIAPTDPGLSSPDSPWAAPTEGGSPGASPGFGTRARSPGSTIPGRRPPTAGLHPGYRPNSQGIAQQVQANRLENMPRQAAATQVAKPFNSYTSPRTTSAYMDLYRSSNEGYNNYSQLVRPALEQQQQNHSFGGQIRGLQSNSRLQAMGLQKLGKGFGQRGTNAPEFYMNHQRYYPDVR